jgi:hypothetical protein
VTKLDRLARSAADLYAIVAMLEGKGVAFKLLDDAAVDTTSRTGKLVMGILALIAEFETAIRRECQMEGIARAKAEGRTGGRPKSVTDEIASDLEARRAAVKASARLRRASVSAWRRGAKCLKEREMPILAYILIICILAGLTYWAVTTLGVPTPLARAIRVAVVVVAVLAILSLLLQLHGIGGIFLTMRIG